MGIRAEVKLGTQAATFAEPDIVTIQINFKIGFYTIEFDDDLALQPVGWQREFALICPGRVVGRDVRDINREGISFVGILQIAVAFHLPHPRNGDFAPGVHRLTVKFGGDFFRVIEVVKGPLATEQHKPLA
ncbi:hypothetical protein D3C75_502390 [compost metagenome]